MPSAICTVNNQTTTSGAVTVSTASTITIALAYTGGVRKWSITCYGTDETSSVSSINTQLSNNKNDTLFTTSYTSGAAGTCLNFRCVVNDGKDDNNTIIPSYTYTFQVNTLINGNPVFATGESMEYDPQFGWIVKMNKPIRAGSVGGASFTAGGDLTGTNTVQTVAKINGVAISGTAASGRVIQATSGTAAQWTDLGSISFTASGDLTGNNLSQTVVKINGATVPAAGSLTANTVLTATGSSALGYTLLYNNHIASSAAIDGTKISPNFGGLLIQTTNNVQTPLITLGSSGPTITSGTGAPSNAPANGSLYLRTDGGSTLGIYIRQGGAWSSVAASATGTAGGDLSGTYPNPTIAQLTGSASTVSLLAANLLWGTSVSSPKIAQADNTVNSATATTTTIQSQNATGTTATGGQLILQSGAGTSANGALILKNGASTVVSVDSATQITFKNTTYIENGNSKGTVQNITASLTTTNATVTTVLSGIIPNGVFLVDAVITAVKSDYTAVASYKRSMTYRNNAGTVAAISTITDGGTKEDNTAWDCTIDNSTNTWRVRVTGVAATNITWFVAVRTQGNIP